MTTNADLDRRIEESLERDGFTAVADVLSTGLVEELRKSLEGASSTGSGVHATKEGRIFAIRNLFEIVPATKRVLEVPALREVVTAGLGSNASCVRAAFLDRAPRAAWKVAWHQEATIALNERVEVTGFGPWTIKDGVHHVMAPPGTLATMLSVRLHLDDCDTDEGVIDVIPSSHQYGRLPEDSIEQFTRYDVTRVPVKTGGLLAMKPLLLRRSNAASRPGPRRVIHLDFCARRLPLPLEWNVAYPLPA